MKKIKEYIKEKKDSGAMPRLGELIHSIENYSYISFDIFDTLLKRNVRNPADIFSLIQIKIGDLEDNFKEKRIEAEKRAREKNNNEITLKEIYDNYDATEPVKEKLKIAELSTEKACLIANPYMLEFFNYCKAHKNVYIISDMYLPKSFIENVLKQNGITGYKKLYVSCEEGKTKSNGSLFDLYIKQEAINPQEAIHIGDSWKSDYREPKRKGLSALHIPRIVKDDSDVFKGTQINLNYLNASINNRTKVNADPYFRFGYQKFGPFLWGYAKWIHDMLKKTNIKKVYFFSRDGFIMMKAFNLLYKKEDIEVHYLEVSRRSLRVPILHFNHSFETIMGMVSPSKMISLVSIFDCVGLDINNYNDLLKKYGFNKNEFFDRKTILNNSALRKLYDDLSQDIENKSNEEYTELVKYLRQENVKGKFGIVDIGWSGGMQRFLTETLDQLKITNDIYGYYIGVANYYIRNVKVIPNLNLNGYLFDFKNNKNAKDKRSSFVGLFETLFLEQAGSVKNYAMENDKVVAKRENYEYVIDGKETRELRSVRQVQKGALQFVEDAKHDEILNLLLNYSADELFEGLRNTGQNPKKEDIELFSEFRFFDEGKTGRLANPRKLIYYVFNPQEFKRDFLLSRWKTGFMKKMLKLNLPYQQLYLWLLQFK